jgi:Ca2+/Na+ antiporter
MVFVVSLVSVVAAVTLHYWALVAISALIDRALARRRRVTGVAVFLALLAHLVEIELFALAWGVLLHHGIAELSLARPSSLDLAYFSGAVFTTLGFGDIVVRGPGRIFAAVEAVVGLVLIAWTASFTYLQMQRAWARRAG